MGRETKVLLLSIFISIATIAVYANGIIGMLNDDTETQYQRPDIRTRMA